MQSILIFKSKFLNLRWIIKILLSGLFFVILFQHSLHPIRAADFSFDYHVSYTVSEKGQTTVKQQVTITNNVSLTYPQQYSLKLSSEKIDSVLAHDTAGPITPHIARANGQTTITVPFNVISAGVGKQLFFELDYVSGDIAHKDGKIWEVIIPGLEKSEGIGGYTIDLTVPESFGKAAYISPLSQKALHWTLSEHASKGITAAFGTSQQFNFNLKYHLHNENSAPEIQEITLPPDTAFQKVLINRISTSPDQVRQDADGNWLASFKLAAGQKLDLEVDGNVLIFPKAQADFATDLTEEERKLYTQSEKYWEQNERITNLAQKLKTPEAIYQYVVDTLTYNYARVGENNERLGAAQIILHPDQAVCMEFSDLFVALARAAGIPAREIHGFAYTNNSKLQPLSLVSDVLHAWPQYYDESQRQWIPIDPTWANTTRGVDYFHKLDFNHIAFAILGTKSDYPFPAGTFKDAQSGKDVFVDFSSDVNTIPQARFEVVSEVKKIVSGVNQKISLSVENTGAVAFTPGKLTLDSPGLTFSVPDQPLSIIPPYGHTDVPVTITAPASFKSQRVILNVQVTGKSFQVPFEIEPWYTPYLAMLPLTLIAFVILIFVWKRKHSKR